MHNSPSSPWLLIAQIGLMVLAFEIAASIHNPALRIVSQTINVAVFGFILWRAW